MNCSRVTCLTMFERGFSADALNCTDGGFCMFVCIDTELLWIALPVVTFFRFFNGECFSEPRSLILAARLFCEAISVCWLNSRPRRLCKCTPLVARAFAAAMLVYMLLPETFASPLSDSFVCGTFSAKPPAPLMTSGVFSFSLCYCPSLFEAVRLVWSRFLG